MKEASSSGACMGRAIPPTVRESNQAWVPTSPVQCQKAETAVMAIQPPGATWRHYNPERGERVVRKAVLARYEPVTLQDT